MSSTTNHQLTSNTQQQITDNNEVLVRVENVSKKFCRSLKKSLWYGVKDIACELTGCRSNSDELRPDEFWAVNDVSFELRRGECLGLIGHNGAGKTTLLKMLNGLIKPDAGGIMIRGRVGALIALGAGFNPILTGRENIYVNATVLGLTKAEIDTRLDEIIKFAEIGEFIDAPVQSYSSGMQVRLGFAVATTLKPDVLILDEVLAVGDASFRSKCWRRIGELCANAAVILVSHEAYAISRICDRAVLLDRGELVHDADVLSALSTYSDIQPTTIPSALQNRHENIKSVDVVRHTPVIQGGESCRIQLIVNSTASTTIDHVVINIIDRNDNVHAQCLPEPPFQPIKIGLSHLDVEIGPLHLSAGEYSLMFMFSTHGGKTMLIHSRNEVGFRFIGPINYGPSYYPPSALHVEFNNVVHN